MISDPVTFLKKTQEEKVGKDNVSFKTKIIFDTKEVISQNTILGVLKESSKDQPNAIKLYQFSEAVPFLEEYRPRIGKTGSLLPRRKKISPY